MKKFIKISLIVIASLSVVVGGVLLGKYFYDKKQADEPTLIQPPKPSGSTQTPGNNDDVYEPSEGHVPYYPVQSEPSKEEDSSTSPTEEFKTYSVRYAFVDVGGKTINNGEPFDVTDTVSAMDGEFPLTHQELPTPLDKLPYRYEYEGKLYPLRTWYYDREMTMPVSPSILAHGDVVLYGALLSPIDPNSDSYEIEYHVVNASDKEQLMSLSEFTCDGAPFAEDSIAEFTMAELPISVPFMEEQVLKGPDKLGVYDYLDYKYQEGALYLDQACTIPFDHTLDSEVLQMEDSVLHLYYQVKEFYKVYFCGEGYSSEKDEFDNYISLCGRSFEMYDGVFAPKFEMSFKPDSTSYFEFYPGEAVEIPNMLAFDCEYRVAGEEEFRNDSFLFQYWTDDNGAIFDGILDTEYRLYEGHRDYHSGIYLYAIGLLIEEDEEIPTYSISYQLYDTSLREMYDLKTSNQIINDAGLALPKTFAYNENPFYSEVVGVKSILDNIGEKMTELGLFRYDNSFNESLQYYYRHNPCANVTVVLLYTPEEFWDDVSVYSSMVSFRDVNAEGVVQYSPLYIEGYDSFLYLLYGTDVSNYYQYVSKTPKDNEGARLYYSTEWYLDEACTEVFDGVLDDEIARFGYSITLYTKYDTAPLG